MVPQFALSRTLLSARRAFENSPARKGGEAVAVLFEPFRATEITAIQSPTRGSVTWRPRVHGLAPVATINHLKALRQQQITRTAPNQPNPTHRFRGQRMLLASCLLLLASYLCLSVISVWVVVVSSRRTKPARPPGGNFPARAVRRNALSPRPAPGRSSRPGSGLRRPRRNNTPSSAAWTAGCRCWSG